MKLTKTHKNDMNNEQRIVWGNDFTLNIAVVEPRENEQGETEYVSTDLSKCTDISCRLVDEFNRTENIECQTEDARGGLLKADVGGNRLSCGSYGLEVSGKREGRRWRFKKKCGEAFSIVDATSEGSMAGGDIADVVNIEGIALALYGEGKKVQADWNETDEDSPAFIRNKPEGLRTTIVLEVNVGTNKFQNTGDFSVVREAMKKGEYVDFVIRSNYASGTRYVHRPTTVKANYISLHSKSGSCELKVSDDGTFTVSGTTPW